MPKQRLELTGLLAAAVSRIAHDLQILPEDVIANALRNLLDPAERISIYLDLFRKYISEGEELLHRGELSQAGEKLWGAVAELLNVIGELKGLPHYRHSDYWRIMEVVVSETKDDELRRLLAVAEKLHANFYHNFIPPENFEGYVKDVKLLIERLRQYIRRVKPELQV